MGELGWEFAFSGISWPSLSSDSDTHNNLSNEVVLVTFYQHGEERFYKGEGVRGLSQRGSLVCGIVLKKCMYAYIYKTSQCRNISPLVRKKLVLKFAQALPQQTVYIGQFCG